MREMLPPASQQDSKDWFRLLVANGVMLSSDLDVTTCRVQRRERCLLASMGHRGAFRPPSS